MSVELKEIDEPKVELEETGINRAENEVPEIVLIGRLEKECGAGRPCVWLWPMPEECIRTVVATVSEITTIPSRMRGSK